MSELRSIVRNGDTGLIPGEVHFDEQFNATSVRAALARGHPLVHIASHFVFRPGNEASSFLLLGDGDKLTLSRIRQDKFDFSRVDLVTLSACETGVGGGRDSKGEEVEGLGAVVQKQGEKGVIATLWPAADESTGLLMQQFYRLRDANRLSKAGALLRAPLLLGAVHADGKLAMTCFATFRASSLETTKPEDADALFAGRTNGRGRTSAWYPRD